jgi:hypothetical protein
MGCKREPHMKRRGEEVLKTLQTKPIVKCDSKTITI